MRASLLILIGALLGTLACGNKRVSDRFGDDGDASLSDGADSDVSGEVVFPDADPTLGGPCVDDKQCERPTIACATFKCELAIHRCRATPDDTKCDDGTYCNGAEKCDPRLGCVPGPVVDCATGDTCMIDTCIEETRGCEHKPRDADDDGDPTAACVALGKDCDDHDPTVSSKLSEVCGNKKDDNCNGMIDESPCITPAYATCDTALVVKTDGTYLVSLGGTSRTIAASCSSMGEFPRQVVAAVTVPADGPKDVDVVATPLLGGRVALASGTKCGDGTTETSCVVQPLTAGSIRLKLRALTAGVHPLYLFGQTEGKVELKISFLPPTAAATNLTCATADLLLDGTKTTTVVTAEVADIGTIPSSCSVAAGPLVYKVIVPSSLGARDLRVRATASTTGVRSILGIRDAGCSSATNELKCGYGYPADLFRRALPVGTYYITLGVTAPTDVTLDATLSAPTAAPADASCTDAPALPRDTTILVNLAGHEDRIAATCVGGPPSFPLATPPLAADAAYSLKLDAASDVLVVAHATGSDQIGVALASPSCTTADLGCARGYPNRLVRRALPAGDYRVVVESTLSSKVSLSTFVRTPAAIAGPVGADKCSDAAVVIPAEGGLFVGTTAGKGADLDASCDSSGLPKGGAPEVIYKLDIAKPSRLILDAFGSAYTTIISLRKGATCPGVEVGSACAAGFFVDNAFLDVGVDAGTYWIVVDGYSLASGAYRLDVRVAPPSPPLP